MSFLKGKFLVTLKLFSIGFLTLLLGAPLFMIQFLVSERQGRRAEAVREIEASWASSQTLVGPILVVPYLAQNSEAKTVTFHAYFLPETLRINGESKPEIRKRSIFRVPVYTAQLDFEGQFHPPDFSQFHIDKKNILWKEAFVLLGIKDMKGIQNSLQFRWQETPLELIPGESSILLSSMQAKIPEILSKPSAEGFSFSLHLSLAGSEGLNFVPVGKETQVNLSSPWPSPSFTGTLPTTREVGDQGFKALWKISYLSRAIPQQWVDQKIEGYSNMEDYRLSRLAFGVNFLFGVDPYQQSTRALKYGTLFLSLTFIAFFLFEILKHLRIHPIQYLLIGVAMCLFYLLLLSLSEHFSFVFAYLIASTTNIFMISGYCRHILGKHSSSPVLMGGLLMGLYGYLYTLLQLEDYALLIGSVGLFAILGLIMFVTRKIDWYEPCEEGVKND